MASSRLCSIPNCGKPHYCKGYCRTHYARFYRHGDPLGGDSRYHTPKGELLRWIHEVALHHAGESCLRWPYAKSENGYGSIGVDGKMVVASRYICEIAHGAPPTPKHEAAHSCGKGHEACVSPRHLGWKTHTENMGDKVQHGTSTRGKSIVTPKLTEDDVRMIIALKGIETRRNTAKRFGVSKGTISNIRTGISWSWLAPKPDGDGL